MKPNSRQEDRIKNIIKNFNYFNSQEKIAAGANNLRVIDWAN